MVIYGDVTCPTFRGASGAFLGRPWWGAHCKIKSFTLIAAQMVAFLAFPAQ